MTKKNYSEGAGKQQIEDILENKLNSHSQEYT